MRNIYIAVAAFFIAVILLFVSVFVYLDKSKHNSYYYLVSLEGRSIGTIKIDRFETEDKTIYKSSSEMPFSQGYSESKTKIEFDRKNNLESYSRESRGNGAVQSVLVENVNNTASFLSREQSRFLYLSGIPLRSGTSVFEMNSPVTYLPFIYDYNFRRGRTQSFNGLIFFSDSMPPMKKIITLTSIKDEYLTIGPRSIKTENLLLKIRNYPQGTLWVSKTDRSIVRLEIPNMKLTFMRTLKPVKLKAEKASAVKEGYKIQEVAVNNKNVRLAGTMTYPSGNGPFPAVLLVAGSGPADREYYGFFESIADYLSRNGYCVLRLDGRGVGQSTGSEASNTLSDQISDAIAAVDFLAAQKEVDPERIAVLSHAQGASIVLKLAVEKTPCKTVILMAPSFSLMADSAQRSETIKLMASKYLWSSDYIDTLSRCMKETEDAAQTAKHGWRIFLGKICFTKNIKEESEENPIDTAKLIKIPVLTLQGREDEEAFMGRAASIDNALEHGKNQNHLLRYYSYLGHFLGKRIIDDTYKMRYEADTDAMGDVKEWLDKNLRPMPAKIEEPAAPKA